MPNRPINGTPENLSVATVPRYAVRLKPTPIPDAAWNDAPLFCLQINDQWVSHLLGVLTALDQPDTWIGTTEEIFAARQQVNEIMLALMEQCDPMSNCCPEPITRITEDGTLQVSYDGGMTWQDATTEDPRNTAPQLPPLTGDDGDEKRCNAANNVLGQFKDGISTFEGYFDTAGTLIAFVTAVAGFIAAVIFAPLAVPIIVGAIIALMSGAWTVGKEAYSAEFTEEVYGDLLCILYCHCQPDGTFNDADFAAIRDDINAHFTNTVLGYFIARDAFLALLNGVTTTGLNTLARIPTGSTASCDSCDCEEGCADLFAVTFGTELARTATSITVAAAFNAPDGVYHAQISSGDMDICCTANWTTPVLEANHVYYPCGLPDTSAVVNGVVPPTTPVWLIDETSGSSFTITYDLTT